MQLGPTFSSTVHVIQQAQKITKNMKLDVFSQIINPSQGTFRLDIRKSVFAQRGPNSRGAKHTTGDSVFSKRQNKTMFLSPSTPNAFEMCT